jgi:hypothetical protein
MALCPFGESADFSLLSNVVGSADQKDRRGFTRGFAIYNQQTSHTGDNTKEDICFNYTHMPCELSSGASLRSPAHVQSVTSAPYQKRDLKMDAKTIIPKNGPERNFLFFCADQGANTSLPRGHHSHHRSLTRAPTIGNGAPSFKLQT